MAKKAFLLSCAAFLLFLSQQAFGVEIRLKSGGIVSGDIVGQDEKGYKIKVRWGEVFVEKDLIKSISGMDEIYLNEIENYYRNGEYEKSLLKINEMLAVSNGSSQNFAKLVNYVANIYSATLDFAKIEGFLNKYPKMQEDVDEAIFNIATQLVITRNERDAIKVYEAYCRDFSTNRHREELLLRIANFYLESKDFAKAIDHYNAILVDYPSTASKEIVSFRLGEAYLKNGNLEKGQAALIEAKAKFPKSPYAQDANFFLLVYSKYTNQDEKINKIFEFIEKNQNSPHIKDAIAILEENLRDSKGIRKYFNKITSLVTLNAYKEKESSNYLKYLIAKSKIDYLKNLVEEKNWNEYSKVKENYESEINRTLKEIVNDGRDPSLSVEASFLKWYFDNIFHNPLEKEDIETLKKALANYVKDTKDFIKIKNIADRFFEDNKYDYAKNLFIQYAEEIKEHADRKEDLVLIVGCINEFSRDSEPKSSILADIVEIYYDALSKFEDEALVSKGLEKIAEDNISSDNFFAAKIIYETMLKKNKNAFDDKNMFNLAYCYDKENKLDTAVYYYNQTLISFPSTEFGDKINLRLAKYFKSIHEYSKAIPFYEAVFNRQVDAESLLQPFDDIISIYYHIDKAENIPAFLNLVMERYKGTALYLKAEYQLAFHYFKKGDLVKAKELFEELSKVSDNKIYAPAAVEMLKKF